MLFFLNKFSCFFIFFLCKAEDNIYNFNDYKFKFLIFPPW